MKAIYFSERLYLKNDSPEPLPRDDEALIRVKYAGICNTDIEIVKGYMNFSGILGHEFTGIVEWAKDKGAIGKRVVGEINIGCGTCDYCLNGMKNHCPQRRVLGILNKDGVFAEYVTMPMENLHMLPDSISDIDAVFIEPLASAFEIINQVNIRPSDKVCILGDGKLGLLVGQVIAMTTRELIVVGKHPERLSILNEKGINTCLYQDFKEKGFDIVIDCTGSPSGIKSALDIVKPMGKIVMKTTISGDRSIDLNRVVIDEITIIGSRCGPFPDAIKALEDRMVNVTPLVSNIFSLDDGLSAFQYAQRKDFLKVILRV